MKGVILTRVSSKEQEEGHSLAAQNTHLIEYAKRHNLDVIKSFQIIESSTTGDRRKFKEVLKFCENQNEKIALIADAVDRVQRSFKDSVLLDDLVRKSKIELHFYREGMIIGDNATATDVMRWDFAVMGAKSYVLQLSENVKRSIDYKIKHGELSGAAPVGYLNYRDESHKSRIRLHDLYAPKVKILFETYSLGRTSLRELKKLSDKLEVKSRSGRLLDLASIHLMLQNPFYYGEMKIKGKLYRHVYEPLISKELWDKCQEVRIGARASQKPYKYSEKPFLYRGLITCANSGKMCSCDIKREKFSYVVCYDKDGKRKYIPEADVNDQITEILKSLKFSEDVLTEIKKHLRDSKEAEIVYRNTEINSLKTSLTRATDRIDRLFTLYLDGEIDKLTYQEKKNDLQLEKDRIEHKIKAHDNADNGFNEILCELLDIAHNCWDIFDSGKNIEKKRLLLKFIFRTLEINNGKLGYALNFPFNELLNLTNCSEWWGSPCPKLLILSISN